MTKWKVNRIEISREYRGYNIKAWRNPDGTWNYRIKNYAQDSSSWIAHGSARNEIRVKQKSEEKVRELLKNRKVIPK